MGHSHPRLPLQAERQRQQQESPLAARRLRADNNPPPLNSPRHLRQDAYAEGLLRRDHAGLCVQLPCSGWPCGVCDTLPQQGREGPRGSRPRPLPLPHTQTAGQSALSFQFPQCAGLYDPGTVHIPGKRIHEEAGRHIQIYA